MGAQSALILGGAGFIGTHLSRALLDSGRLRKIVSIDVQAPARPVHHVIYRHHDVRRPIQETIDEHFDLVFNLAAIHRTPGHADGEYYDTNVAGALNCVAYCERNGIDTVLFTSSISVYGPSEAALDETAPLKPNSAYGKSKRLAEEIHRAWHERSGSRRLRIVRPAVVFGEGEQGNFTRLAKLLRRGIFVYPGRTDTRKAGGYVKELARTMLFALDRPESFYLYNFADRYCPTAAEICEAFCVHQGMHRPRGVMPLWAVEGAAMSFEALNALGLRNSISRERIRKLVYSTCVVPQRLIDDRYQFAYGLQAAIQDWLACDPEVRPAGFPATGVQSAPIRLISNQPLPAEAQPIRRAGNA